MIVLASLWLISFFISFLYLQHFDREHGTTSAYSTLFNLVVASVPGVNVIAALFMWL